MPTERRQIESVPKEMKKTFSAQHAQSGGRRRRRSIAQRRPDADIFNLGDAMKSGEMNLDDFLGTLDKRSDVTIEKGKDGKTKITQIQHVDKDGVAIPMIDIDGDGIPDILDPTKKAVKQQKKVLTITDPAVLATIQEDKEKKAKKKDEKLTDEVMTDADMLAGLGTRAKYIAINMDADDEDDEDDDESSDDEGICSKCWSFCCRCDRCRQMQTEHKANSNLKKDDEEAKSGAKAGMAASEVDVPGEEAQMPEMKRMIYNYNRMLEDDPDEFRDVLFRAVKLNGVEVVKLLCRLAARKGVKLGSLEMREPASSATVLHVALLYNNEAIAEHLIRMGDTDLLLATYTRKEYENQTALHLAVANGNLKLVDILLRGVSKSEKRQLMNTVASGTFFREDHPEGQLCLSAAAWSKNSETLTLLAKHGASFATQNLKGNTLLHSIVLSSGTDSNQTRYEKLIDRVFEAVGEWAKQCKYTTRIPAERELEVHRKQIKTFHKLLALPNDNGVTPLILAAQIGSPLLIYLLNVEKIYKIPQSSFGSVAWVTYDVSDVTTFARDQYNKFSVLHVLAHNKGLGREEGEENPLEVEPIRSLIRAKWSVYRWVYIAWCILHFMYMCAFTHFSLRVTRLGNPDESDPEAMQVFENNHGLHKKLAFLFVFLPIFYIISEFLDWFGSRPYGFQLMHNKTFLSRMMKRSRTEWVITGNGPYRMVLLLYSLSGITWSIHFLHDSDLQIVFLSLTLLLGWIFVLFFTRGCRVTSKFSIMIQKMFFRDLMYFMAVYLVIMVAFTFAVHALYAAGQTEGGLGIVDLLYTMFNIVVEVDDKDDMPVGKYAALTKAVIIMYTVMGVVLLLNMLIAMMNTSYEVVSSTGHNIYKQQQLSIMLMLERRLFWLKKLCKYSESNLWYKKWGKYKRAYIDVSTTSHMTEDGVDLAE
ncbi:hypothetical protein CAPTEDRAFT_220668 [Capitella teleta]|uniref:Uncharacterized protein n=1 Tax=Capitella teleta TaxID=283909 RepID=R7V2Z2_CAPTE|nr:hypothetical protein CAPTEDRAFT_220668 [Capitella teleta]|eukprot:ELU10676.1 hypothetical protein CAPTEDRAFT_220668 [Capitella teleta]